MDELYTAGEWGRRQTGSGGIGSLSLAHPFWADIWIGAMGTAAAGRVLRKASACVATPCALSAESRRFAGQRVEGPGVGLHAREKVGVLAIEVVALLSRMTSLWRAVRLDGVRRLMANDDAMLVSCAVARLSACCADPLFRWFESLFVVVVDDGANTHRHTMRYK
jgi:hypothetical protein